MMRVQVTIAQEMKMILLATAAVRRNVGGEEGEDAGAERKRDGQERKSSTGEPAHVPSRGDSVDERHPRAGGLHGKGIGASGETLIQTFCSTGGTKRCGQGRAGGQQVGS